MNYSGKVDAKLHTDGLGTHFGANTHLEAVHATHLPPDAVVVSDAQLLFNAEFKRAGVDLVLSGEGREVVLHDYFKGEHRASLASPDGAHLTGDLVTALAGEVQYAQADGNADAHKVIGHVTKLVGTATVVRNGVSIILNNGDNVEKSDVVSSGSDSTLGITFIDGTVFGLSSNARMVLNEMVYDPNGSNNSSLLSLVAGTITFVAGETAKHGDMKVDTPVATMGIRGTAVLVEIDFSVPGTTPDAKFQVLVEPDGTTGSYILFDKTTLTPLAVVNQAGTQINISNGIMSQTLAPLSPEIQQLINDVFTLKFSDNSNTKSLDHFTDTITPTGPGSTTQFALLTGMPTIPVIIQTVATSGNSLASTPVIDGHIPIPPTVVASSATLVRSGTAVDTVTGTIRFADINAFDQPSASARFVSLTLTNAKGQDITASLTASQLATLEAALTIAQDPAHTNNGTATYTYSVADSALGFLGAGDKLTLTYNAIVNNNFTASDQTGTQQFTITIVGSGGAEVWSETTTGNSSHPGDWNAGENWQSGSVPTANDPVVIGTNKSQGTTLFYPVTIKSVADGGVAAFASSVTMTGSGDVRAELDNYNILTIGNGGLILNADSTLKNFGTVDTHSVTMNDSADTPPELDNYDTLTIGNGDLQLNADSILKNFGTISIGGIAEILQHSVLQNSGTLTLEQGGDFADQSSITNAGTIEVAGGTLTVEVDIANSGGTLQVDNGAILTLSGATIDGGIINGPTNFSLFSSIDITGPSTISNVSLNDGQVTIASGVTLTLDNDTVNGTAFNDIASGATIQIDDGTILTLTEAAINGGTIDDGTVVGASSPAFGSIDITGPSTIDNAFLNNGEVTIASGVTLTLDNDTVSGTAFNDAASGATIQIDDGTTLTLTDATINGGIVNDGTVAGTSSLAFGAIAVTGPSTISNAFLNNGEVTIANDATLTLSNDVVTSTAFFDAAASGFAGTIDINGTVTFQSGVVVDGGAMSIAKGATLDIENPVTGVGATLSDVDIINSGTIQVDLPGLATEVISLVLDGGTTLTNGTLLIHVGFPQNGIEGAVEIGTGGATFNNVTVDDNNILTIDSGVALTLDDSTVFKNGDLAIGALGLLDVERGPSALPEGTPDATLDGVAVANGGNLEVGTTSTGDPILLLDGGTTVSNGALTVGSVGTLEIGASGATLNGVAVENNNLMTIDDSVTLTLTDNTIISGGNLTIGALGVLDIEQGSGALEGVAVTNDGNIEIGMAGTGNPILLLGNGTIVSDGALTVGLDGALDIGAAGATLDDVTIVNGNVIEVLAGSVLDLDFGTRIVNFGAFLTVDGALDLNGAVIAGGTLSGDGTIATTGGVNTFEDVTIAGPTTVDVTANTVLNLTDLAISDDTLLEGSGQVVLTDDAQNAILSDGSAATLTNASAISGAGTIGGSLLTLVNDGNIDATGANALIIDTGVNTPTNAGPQGSQWSVGSLEVTNDSAGVLEASPGHVLQIDDNVLNNGLIQAGNASGTSTAVVDVAGNISGTGSIDIFDNARVEIGGSVSSGQTVTFEVASGSGELILDDPHDFHGLVQGLVEASSEAAENYIDLKGFAYTFEMHTSLNSVAGITVVTIANGSNPDITIDLAGSYRNGDFEFASDGAGGTFFSDPAANSGAVTINSNTTLEIASTSTATVSFANGSGTTGALVLENSTGFTGSIAGFAGDGTISHSDLIDLADLNFASVATNKTTFTEDGNDAGTLTLYNGSGQVLDSITFDGHYQLANFIVENDGSGDTLILDPPVSSAGPSFANGVGPANASTTAPKPAWSSFANGDNFAFNFAGGAHATMAGFHPLSDVLSFGNASLASVQAALNAAHDEYANADMDLSGHHAWNDIHKVLPHVGDFHVV